MLEVNKLDLESMTSNSKSSCHSFSFLINPPAQYNRLIYVIVIVKYLLTTDFVVRPMFSTIDAYLKHGGSFKTVDSCLAANLDFLI